MGKSNVNWEPNLKDANKKRKKEKYGIDANADERYADLGNSARKKKGFGKVIALIIIGLIIFDALVMQGEIFINVFKSLLDK